MAIVRLLRNANRNSYALIEWCHFQPLSTSHNPDFKGTPLLVVPVTLRGFSATVALVFLSEIRLSFIDMVYVNSALALQCGVAL